MTSPTHSPASGRSLRLLRTLIACALSFFFTLGPAVAGPPQVDPRYNPNAAGGPPPSTKTRSTSTVDAQPSETPGPVERRNPSPAPPVTEQGPQPFGSNLFLGNFARVRDDGLNPDYSVVPGDRVALNTWGSVQINDIFIVDTQGNVFLPEIGPVHLAGVKNSELTSVVKRSIQSVYRRNFDVYTILLTANPVAVFVTGGVTRPGRYAGVPSDSVLFFLDQAGGIDPRRGSYRHIELLRQGKRIAEIDLYDFILLGSIAIPQLKENDTILVKSRGPIVELRGDVVTPAFVELDGPQATGTEVLAVIPKQARATEVTVEGIRAGHPYNKTLPLGQFQDMTLRDGDVVNVRADYRPQTILVNLEGEFAGPSVLSVQRGSRLLDVLNYVPVDPQLANTSAIHIRRASVARAQKDSINDSLFRLERAALLALSSSNGVSDIRVKEAELTRKFVERARNIDPLGRVVTAADGRQLNVALENGDTIVIPRHTNVVRIGGEVLMSQALLYRHKTKVSDYVKMAGGYSHRADSRKAIIIHADASVEMANGKAVLRPGDEILIPPKIDLKIVQGLLDVSAVIYQIAVATGFLIPLFGGGN